MYADRVEAVANKSVKERLNRGFYDDPTRRLQVTGKRQRQDDKWEHDLYEDDEQQTSNRTFDSRDLRLKLQRRSNQQGSQIVKGPAAGLQDLRQKLSGTMTAQPVNADPPKTKPEAARLARRSAAIEANAAPQKKSQQKVDSSVESFLLSLGLEKYLINFQVEEVDMSTLVHMTDEELKTIGIPMGPRKKILLALESKG